MSKESGPPVGVTPITLTEPWTGLQTDPVGTGSAQAVTFQPERVPRLTEVLDWPQHMESVLGPTQAESSGDIVVGIAAQDWGGDDAAPAPSGSPDERLMPGTAGGLDFNSPVPDLSDPVELSEDMGEVSLEFLGQSSNPENAMVGAGQVPDNLPPADDAVLVQRVLTGVQRQVDAMLEYRLRESMGPILLRASEIMMEELRAELGATLRDVVSRAVAQELARQQRQRG
jgi:hypothetical protein